MIRKAIIVVLTLAAVGSMLLWAWSFRRTVYIMPSWWGSDRIFSRSDGIDLWSGQPPEWIIRLSPLIMSIEHKPWVSPPGTTYRLPNAPLGLMIVMAAYPAFALIRGPLRRWQRRRKGQCLKCAYDLTGNETGICPECGEAR